MKPKKKFAKRKVASPPRKTAARANAKASNAISASKAAVKKKRVLAAEAEKPKAQTKPRIKKIVRKRVAKKSSVTEPVPTRTALAKTEIRPEILRPASKPNAA